jgi:hypothetical protein
MATTKDITVDQGATHIESFTLETLTDPTLAYNASTNPYIPLDISLSSLRMQVRATHDSALTLISATDANGLFLKTTPGSFNLVLTPASTNSLRFVGDQANYVYDIFVDLAGGVSIKAVQGIFNINRKVTR